MHIEQKDRSKEKNSPVPLYVTNPFPLGEKTSEEAEKLAVQLAKKWVDENHI